MLGPQTVVGESVRWKRVYSQVPRLGQEHCCDGNEPEFSGPDWGRGFYAREAILNSGPQTWVGELL